MISSYRMFCPTGSMILNIIPVYYLGNKAPYTYNAPINVIPHYPPPEHYRGQGGDLTN